MAGSDYGGGGGPPGGDWARGAPPAGDSGYHGEPEFTNLTPTSTRNGQNGGSGYGGLGRPPASPALSANNTDDESRRSGERNRSRPRGSRNTSGQDCGQIVASKFFPADDEHGGGQYPLCETDYFRRLGLLCHTCGGALRGSYITALDHKYHIDHFTCSLCPTVFGAADSYYEHDGQVYCHYHYSTQFAQRCEGCQTAILKQFVEIFRNQENQHWHPECYMIHKFWNVRLNPPFEALGPVPDTPAGREKVKEEEERMEEKVYRIWSVLSTFEESSAACISDMLLHVSNGAHLEGVVVAKRFIWHVDMLFQSADRLDTSMAALDMTALAYGREAKLLCKKVVSFFSLLSKSQEKGSRKLGVTQELLTLVTGLAHYLKLLIRICLKGALRTEKERNASDCLYHFLDDLGDLEGLKVEDNPAAALQLTGGLAQLAKNESDQCQVCRRPVEDECLKNGDRRWHINCANCSQCGIELGRNVREARLDLYSGKMFCRNCEAYASENAPPFERVSRLQQYVYLLQVALARLLDMLQAHGIIQNNGEGPNGLESADGYPAGVARSRSVTGEQHQHHRGSSYENALNDVRRLKSTRMDKHLSTSFRKARTSRIIDGNETGVPPGSAAGIAEERGDEDENMMLPNSDALTLDDIPKIVAAEQASRERGPYAGRQELFRSAATDPNFASSSGAPGFGHQRSHSDGRSRDMRAAGEPSPQRGSRKYFSELSGLEYFIVRHLAVLTMHPMVEQEFTLEELLSFIESRKPANFWKNIGKAFKNDGRKNVKKKGVFGVPLDVIVERDGVESTDGVGPGTLRIPAIVDDIVSIMRQMDLSVEGVFRKNGNIKKLNEMVEKIDKEEPVDLGSNTVIQIAALLKRYLRELPDPLMTHKLYRLWLAAAKIQDDEKRRYCLHLACCLLPKSHRDCMEILFSFLKWTGSFHQVDEEVGSKMDIKNLATVIAPNIVLDKNKTSTLDSDPMFAIEAVEVLISNIEEMCLVPDELAEYLTDQSFSANGGELTTKEILRRFSDRNANGHGPRHYTEVTEVSRHENATRPPPRRIETDPASWQESSVRPVQDPPTPYGNPHQGTPPQPRRGGGYDGPGQQSPYGHFERPGANTPESGEPRRSSRSEGLRLDDEDTFVLATTNPATATSQALIFPTTLPK
ncbi:hypothetical protein OQA88_6754 [Cercophora sp. LCS_1]